MTRFEKKCLVGAAGLHGLLVVIFVATAAFQGEPPKQTIVPITWLALQTTDKPGLMAGNPNATPTAVKAQTPAAKPPEPAAQPQPEKPQPRSEPTPPKVQADPPPKPHKHSVEPDITPVHHTVSEPVNPKSWKPRLRSADDIKVDISTPKTKTTRHQTSSTSNEEADARAQAAAQRRTAREIGQALSGLASSIPKGTAKATVFDLPGQGGGAAFVDYRTALFSAYYNAWNCPPDVDNDLSSVEVKVVVARNGSVISAEITKKSSDSSLNRSVQRALDAVQKLPPFPEGTKDDQRSFKLRFNVKAKQSLG
ncbi:MAG: energy transducer TonB [Limisphaerales bacterium]